MATFVTGFTEFKNTAGDFEDIRGDATDNAKKIAKARCRDKNKNEWTCTLKVVGNVNLVAGVTVEIKNWGKYSGKYIVDEAVHTVSDGYETTIKAHKVLGY